MERTHYNGTLSINDVSKEVTLIGWVSKVRNLGSLKFIDLRDRSGTIQIFIKEDFPLPDIKNEYIIQVIGTISKKSVANPLLKTGQIEVIATMVKVISKAETPPIIVDDKTDALEETRLKYRYLDLRRPLMQQKLIMKANIMAYWRAYLDDLGFIEIETPLLTRSTPEGARDYLVPSRIHHGSFYALPQSPQIYKQLLMIGGLERYYQLARCFRDEDLRADRQPDFTQIDIEASFLSFDSLLSLLERGVIGMFKSLKDVDIASPIKRITYQEAMEGYGSDKPDLRFDLPIVDFSKILTNSLEPFANSAFIKGFVIKNSAHILTRKVLDEFNLELKKFNVKPLIKFTLTNGQLESSFNKFLTPEIVNQLVSHYQLNEGDTILLTSGATFKSFHFGLGSIRNKLAKLFNLIDENSYSLLWVYDFPLFEVTDDGHLTSSHHPFTRPVDEDIHLLATNPQLVRSYAYDLVINGYEAGGGSLRIYDKDLQHRIFTLLGLSEADIKEKFGWFIEAFNYGTPPHGGIAFGLDRLTMILTKTDNIRDVIAFPKNLSGVAPLERSPSKVSIEQLNELALSVKENK